MTIEQVLATSKLVLETVSPNPTAGLIQMTFQVPPGYANDALLEIYNELGEKLGERHIVFPVGMIGTQTIDLDLKNGTTTMNNGILYLRIRTSLGFITSKVILAMP